MTGRESSIVLELARKAAEAASAGDPPPAIPEEDILRMESGAFVTLRSAGRLRGCIGHFAGLGSLGETVRAMAREAAVGDPRFMPVTPEEMKAVTIEVSVLSPMERIEPEEVKPGVHGLYIRRGPRAGTLLPQVAVEERWTAGQFLDHTCLKAGLSPEAWKEPDTEIYAYTAEVIREEKERQ